MKKIIAIVLMLCMMIPTCFADTITSIDPGDFIDFIISDNCTDCNCSLINTNTISVDSSLSYTTIYFNISTSNIATVSFVRANSSIMKYYMIYFNTYTDMRIMFASLVNTILGIYRDDGLILDNSYINIYINKDYAINTAEYDGWEFVSWNSMINQATSYLGMLDYLEMRFDNKTSV